MEEKIVRIYGELTPQVMPGIVEEVLEGCVNHKKITFLINSGGGKMRLYTQIKNLIEVYKPAVKTVCIGDAYSTAGMIFLLGNERIMMGEKSRLLFHEPSRECAGNYSELKDLLKTAEELYDDIVVELFAKCHNSFTEAEVKNKLREEWYLESAEALKYGFATRVILKDPYK